ncbi:MAG TPA: diguanylate cyclase [Candidatus Limnocylindrales bacterium]|nr:diguanylate cyclase [Candidatus Limnocylindrales bacterium]
MSVSLIRPRRRALLLVVYGAGLTLVIATAAALDVVVGQHVSQTAVDSTVAADRSLARSFAGQALTPGDLIPGNADQARTASIGSELAAIVKGGEGILQLKIHSVTGSILFSDRAALEGTGDANSPSLEQAIASGQSVANLETADESDSATVGAPKGSKLIEEYLPILDGAGRVTAVFEIYRNAAPVLAAADASQRDVLIVTTVAAIVLALLLHLIFRAAQSRLARQTDELLEAQRRDALTGMLNHGTAVGLLAAQIESARIAGEPVGVALVDIDNFRLLNDTHGHPAGDTALRKVASVLRSELSNQSIVGRYGPDELIIVAPPGCSHDLEPAIERLRSRLADLSLQFGTSERLPLTVSAGICFSPVDGDAPTELLSVATVTLGEAKASGGDAIRVARAELNDMGVAERSSFDVLVGLVIAVDTKDRYTKRHSEDVARYATFLAKRIEADPDLIRTLGIAGLLHDIGKIGIPDAILRKPAALTADEYEIVKQHVKLGDSIVRDLPNLDEVRAGIRHHHERWDGTGYLHGLEGEEIPLIARLLSVADAFSAMTTSRPYRKALSIGESLRRLEDAAGSQLDPTLVTAFVSGIETAADAPLPGDNRGLSGPTGKLWTPADRVA